MTDQRMDGPEDETNESLRLYPLNKERFQRLSKNMAMFLNELIQATNELASRSETSRKRVFADLRVLLDEIPIPDQGVLLTRLEHEVQRILDLQGTPKVERSEGCVGRSGGGLKATEGDVTVGACVTTGRGGVTGGGVEVSFRY
jgi:hypothetical protein